MRGRLGHVAAVAGRADATALAGEGHDESRAARHADRAGEAEAPLADPVEGLGAAGDKQAAEQAVVASPQVAAFGREGPLECREAGRGFGVVA